MQKILLSCLLSCALSVSTIAATIGDSSSDGEKAVKRMLRRDQAVVKTVDLLARLESISLPGPSGILVGFLRNKIEELRPLTERYESPEIKGLGVMKITKKIHGILDSIIVRYIENAAIPEKMVSISERVSGLEEMTDPSSILIKTKIEDIIRAVNTAELGLQRILIPLIDSSISLLERKKECKKDGRKEKWAQLSETEKTAKRTDRAREINALQASNTNVEDLTELTSNSRDLISQLLASKTNVLSTASLRMSSAEPETGDHKCGGGNWKLMNFARTLDSMMNIIIANGAAAYSEEDIVKLSLAVQAIPMSTNPAFNIMKNTLEGLSQAIRTVDDQDLQNVLIVKTRENVHFLNWLTKKDALKLSRVSDPK